VITMAEDFLNSGLEFPEDNGEIGPDRDCGISGCVHITCILACPVCWTTSGEPC